MHICSSVVNPVADDDANTGRAQEKPVVESGIRHCVLRPTLMFGWFDPKHPGRPSRSTPVFPIPGGSFMRQPLYERDFCRCIATCIEREPDGATTCGIAGDTRVDCVDIIRTIKRVKNLHTLIVHIPIGFFAFLLRTCALFSRKPPFTADPLKALGAGNGFKGEGTQAVFGVKRTPLEAAIRESRTAPLHASIMREQ